MSYGTPVVNGLQSAHIKLLRFPGGNWGEQHAYSHAQLDAFSTLLNQTGASGILQVPLSSVGEQGSTLATRASNAALVVDYMNNKNSLQRAGQSAQVSFSTPSSSGRWAMSLTGCSTRTRGSLIPSLTT